VDGEVGAVVVRRLDEVRGRDRRQPAHLAEPPRRDLGVPGRRVEPGADRGRAEVDLEQQLAGDLEAPDLLADVHGEPRELLAEAHRHGVLELRATHLEDVGELGRLLVERALEPQDLLLQPLNELVHREAEPRGVGVVGRLRAVDVVVRVDDVVAALLEPGELEREVGHDLVGVHVDARARAALEHVHRELVEAPAVVEDRVARGDDRVRDVALDRAQLAVRERRRLLDHHHAADHLGDVADRRPRDAEVLHGPDGVDPVVRVRRDLEGSQQVFLDPCPCARHAPTVSPAGALRAERTRQAAGS